MGLNLPVALLTYFSNIKILLKIRKLKIKSYYGKKCIKIRVL
jgi:hypothetical protein